MRAEDVIPPSPQTDSTLIGAQEEHTSFRSVVQGLWIGAPVGQGRAQDTLPRHCSATRR